MLSVNHVSPRNCAATVFAFISLGFGILEPSLRGQAVTPGSEPRTFFAPPPAEVLVAPDPYTEPLRHRMSTELELYSIGEPTPEEQLYLELINRARANPSMEGELMAATTDPDVLGSYEFFNVQLNVMKAAFAAISPAPPLSMNPLLTIAARRHSLDMLNAGFQGHTGSDGSTIGSRIDDAGYLFSRVGENVFAHADSVWHGHVGFEVDWGNGPDGMQNPPGHRDNIHQPAYREVGIGVVSGTNTVGGKTYGPQLVSQEFGAARTSLQRPFITGVVHYDINGNNFYDLDEGIGGVQVTVTGNKFYGMTASSGGYSVPVPGDGTYEVTFSAPGLAAHTTTVTVTSQQNVKLDYSPAYTPPVLSGPAQVELGSGAEFQISPVPAAKDYQWRALELRPFTRVEGAEDGTGSVLLATSAGYNPIVTGVAAAGTRSFHFVHPAGLGDESLQLLEKFRANANSQLSFSWWLGVATSDQIARAQVSTDNGVTWTDLWSMPGSSNVLLPASFSQATVPLGAYAGQDLLIRFVYEFAGGQFFNQVDQGFGLYLDEIRVNNVDELVGERVTATGGSTSFRFQPDHVGSFVLSARAQVGAAWLPWGPPLAVTSIPGQPRITLTKITRVNGANEIDFEVTNLAGSASFRLLTSGNLRTWHQVQPNSISELVPGRTYRIRYSTRAGIEFYRVAAE